MNRTKSIFFVSALIISLNFCSSHAMANKVVTYVDNFALLDHQGKEQELYYYSDMKAVVLIWQSNGCESLRERIPYINKLMEEYESKGIKFLMINADIKDDRFSIQKEAKEFNINIPILEDSSQAITKNLQVQNAGEVILLDTTNWNIVYRGAIVGKRAKVPQNPKKRHEFFLNALKNFLLNKEIKGKDYLVKGCPINFFYDENVEQITYVNDVAPILIQKCQKCHSLDGAAPFSLDNYKKVRGWAKMIREVVRLRRMPPFKPDPYYGKFQNDSSLTPQEVRKLVHWIEEGFIRGEGEDPLPKAIKPRTSEWQLGEPDMIFTLKHKQYIPAIGIWDWRYLEMDRVVPEDLWIKDTEILPSNTAVMHHATAMKMSPDVEPEDFKRKLRVKNFIASYVPGRIIHPNVLDMGIFVPKGSKIVSQTHYVTTGKPEVDQLKLGLYLHDQPPARSLTVVGLRDRSFRIPPGAKDFKIMARKTIKKAFTLYILGVHMHYRARSAKLSAIYPDGSHEVLLSVPDYDYNWQFAYNLAEAKDFPPGTEIIFEGIFDNSPQNPDNPDPTQEVIFGERSDDEMFEGFLGIAYY